MLVAVLMLGASASHIALQGEKAARNDRDRHFALEAAESALRDAERDLEQSSRSNLFAEDAPLGFSEDCLGGSSGLYTGLCLRAPGGATPVWQRIDLTNSAEQSVPFGRFTGRLFQSGEGLLPAHPPRYLIELVPYSFERNQAAEPDVIHLYRITAIGFGFRKGTHVVLQTFYRRIGGSKEDSIPRGRLSWREISNWQELHDAYAKG
jgi:type IV pilus assembly protein PilX